MNGLGKIIKEKFKLFQGIRARQEDQKIYDKVVDLCFDETMLFLSENLTEPGRQNLKKELKKQKSDEDKSKTLSKYLSTIENSENKLGWRISAFLNNLLYSSVNKKYA